MNGICLPANIRRAADDIAVSDGIGRREPAGEEEHPEVEVEVAEKPLTEFQKKKSPIYWSTGDIYRVTRYVHFKVDHEDSSFIIRKVGLGRGRKYIWIPLTLLDDFVAVLEDRLALVSKHMGFASMDELHPDLTAIIQDNELERRSFWGVESVRRIADLYIRPYYHHQYQYQIRFYKPFYASLDDVMDDEVTANMPDGVHFGLSINTATNLVDKLKRVAAALKYKAEQKGFDQHDCGINH